MRTITFITVLAIGGVIGVIDPPHFDLAQVNAALMRFSEHSLAFIQRSFTPVKAETEPIDAHAAAKLDDDLDWRIASQGKSDAALRAYLDQHPHGAHAVEAQLKLDKIIAPPMPPMPPAPPSPPPPKPVAVAVAVPLLTSPVVDMLNAPPRNDDVFAALEDQAPPRTIIKWKHDRPHTVVEWRYARPRYRPPPPPPNFLAAFLGPREPHRWSVQPRRWHGYERW
jgi:hypothetical protein